MLSIQNVKLFSGSKGPDGPDLQSPFWRKFHISLHTLSDDVRSISQNVAEKRHDSRHNKLKNKRSHNGC